MNWSLLGFSAFKKSSKTLNISIRETWNTSPVAESYNYPTCYFWVFYIERTVDCRLLKQIYKWINKHSDFYIIRDAITALLKLLLASLSLSFNGGVTSSYPELPGITLDLKNVVCKIKTSYPLTLISSLLVERTDLRKGQNQVQKKRYINKAKKKKRIC